MKIDNKLDSIASILSKLNKKKSGKASSLSSINKQEDSVHDVLASTFSKTNINDLSDRELCNKLVSILLLDKLGAENVSEDMVNRVSQTLYDIINNQSSFIELRKLIHNL
ncbi:hypothetical protein [Zooshikella harenae]|uniref:Uncharacterized protein n=1 Tax=Zooshikella harenae TaxID=2827238 RepID=A0ABS5ZFB6_9GAMM|nr:hypothetical protein [Zooshikella harenae]MBU2711672.1 hypothetical protein [Zooshikella harenae]